MYLNHNNSDPKDHLDIEPGVQPYHPKSTQRPGVLPSIDTMALPGFSYSSRSQHMASYKHQLDTDYTSASPSQSYPDTHIYSSAMNYPPSQTFPRSYYRTDADISDRDIRYEHEPRQMSYSQTNHPLLTNLITSDLPSQPESTMLMSSNSAFYPEPLSATTKSSSSQSPPDANAGSSSKHRKTRREKPRIELASDQPLTTQGKLRSRVYVACMQCRTRKIRCDGAKPACHNCSRRPNGNQECCYDSAPKRRGPDKTPGARQRTVRGSILDGGGSGGGGTRRRRKKKFDDEFDATNIVEQNPSQETGEMMRHPVAGLSAPPVPVFLVPPSSEDVTSSRDVPKFSDVSQNVSLNAVDNGFPTPIQGFGEGDRYDISTDLKSSSHRPYLDDYNYQRFLPGDEVSTQSYQRRINDDYDESSEDVINITSEPSLDFTRKTWWDSLLVIYASSSPAHVPALTISERNQASNLITRDLRFLFRSSNYWFSFFNVPRFFSTYFEPEKRDQMQPSLVIAALAIATFFQSSEAGLGEEGRKKALRLRDIAQGSLEASLNGRWIDETLAQAAWLLAMFEVCAHPLHSTERSASSMVMLDTIIRSLSLTFLDANDPHASKFAPRTVPTVPAAHSNTSWSPSDAPPAYPIPRTYYPSSGVNYNYSSTQVSTSSTKVDKGCSCASLSLGQRWSGASEHTPLWLSTPAWDENWTDGEIRKESCRRLCWSALMLTAGHSSYTNSCNRLGPELFLVEPANYVLLFPGEALTRSQALTSDHSPKDTVWALYYRTMLLWHSCLGIRLDPNATEEEKARFGVNAWLEADALDKALDSHTCGLERAFLFQGREYLFNVRMCISYEFQRYIPLATANANGLFHRTKAEEWLSHQANVAQRVVHAMHTVTGQASNTVVHRPFFAFWFMSQISRALSLWECDNSLTIALEVCMAFLKPIDYLSTLWPCEEQRSRCRKLREQLTRACSIAGRPPPPPPPSFEYSPTSVP